MILRLGGDRWWPATMVLFGPRWLFVSPLLVLFPITCLHRRRALAMLAVSAWIGVVPVMGFSIPWRAAFSRQSASPPFRVLTCNIHRHQINIQALQNVIAEQKPDIIALQEWSSKYDAIFAKDIWHLLRQGEVLLASRFPITKSELIGEGFEQPGDAVCFDIDTPNGKVHVVNVHLASPHYQIEDVLDRSPSGGQALQSNSERRHRQSQAVRRYVDGLGPNTIIAGDFNTPDDSFIFRESWTGLSDAFQTAGWGFGNTYFAHKTSVRIDHLLSANGLKCEACWVGPSVNSPHRPLIADFNGSDLKSLPFSR